MSKPPTTWQVVIVAALVCIALTLLLAYELGAFTEELHPDPTRGSIAGVLSIFIGLASYPSIVALLLLARSLLWPATRTRTLLVGSLAFLLLWSFAAAAFLGLITV